ncbi:Beta-site APP-cleaving enzyme [Apophysomyces ossiformis]|uniref:Beta-site APP-cleaving enzyme n=1 Tax=Apophysomyces ossiformis TaxID=679940 RepID=A0A8H7BZ35_9FUNG|nr:Beta-site APP-cleaving enzyme [Apophysomyces ossiformis]
MAVARWAAHLDLQGSPTCHYYVTVTVGSTPVNLVFDLGSANTAVISDLCDGVNCSFVQKPYLPAPALADRRHWVNATYLGNIHMRASWAGYATTQLVSFGNKAQALARVDAIVQNSAFFVPRCPQNQGILGLAYATLQTVPNPPMKESQKTVIDAIIQQHGAANMFSLQLCPKSAHDPRFRRLYHALQQTKSSPSLQSSLPSTTFSSCHRRGHFWLGGYSSSAVGSPIDWVPLVKSRYYEVQVDHFLVNDRIVTGMSNINSPRTIVDSGAKNIMLSPENLQLLLRALWESQIVQFDRRSVSEKYERAFWLDHAMLSVPMDHVTIVANTTVAVSLSGRNIKIPVENLLTIRPGKDNFVNISWTGLTKSGHGSKQLASTILGNSLLRGKTVIFDRDTHRIGFADAAFCCNESSAQDVNVFPPQYDVASDHRREVMIMVILAVFGTVLSLAFIAKLLQHAKKSSLRCKSEQHTLQNGTNGLNKS